jgi:hypothetical protein
MMELNWKSSKAIEGTSGEAACLGGQTRELKTVSFLPAPKSKKQNYQQAKILIIMG